MIYANRSNVTSAEETNFLEEWQACVVPNDDKEDGSEVCSDILTIAANQLPVVDEIILNSSEAANESDENLTAYVTISDSDGDTTREIYDWKFNGSSIAILNVPIEPHNLSSTTAVDYSDNQTNGTIVNAVPRFNFGHDGFGAYLFDNNGDYINFGDVDFISDTEEFTLIVWINATAHGQDFIFGDEVSGNKGVMMQTDSSGRVQTYFGGYKTSSYKISPGFVEMLIYVQNSSGLWLYVNGTGYSEKLMSDRHLNTNHNLYAGSWRAGQRSFNGIIYEIMVYDRQLTDTQLDLIYQNKTMATLDSNQTLVDD